MFFCEVGSLLLWCAMRYWNLHYQHAQECQFYSVLLLRGFPWPTNIFWIILCLGCRFPMFPPKQKTHEDFVDLVKIFVTAHGRVPERRDEVESGRKLYSNLQKNKKLDVLQPYLMERGVLFAVDVFYTQHQRLPKRTRRTASEEATREDNLARRWHRVLQCHEDGELAGGVVDCYGHLFAAAGKLDAEQAENVCRAVDIFLHEKEHLPRRQEIASDEAKREII